MSERRHKSDAEYLDEANEAVRELVTAQANRICRNCRWWDGPPRDEWACCELVEAAIKDSERDGFDLLPQNPKTKAHATTSDGTDAGLIVRYDFGCVQWEGKE